MTTLKQLIDLHCPGGVDYVRLGDVVTIKNGSDWKTQEPGSVAVYGSGGKMGAKVKIPASTEPSVLLPRKGSLEVQFVDTPFWNIDTAFRTETDPTRLCMKYFYYLMKGFNLTEISTSATRPSLTQTALKKLSFPLPPREVQDKVVEYLDTFAAVCENLDTDIAQREQQFTACREEIFKTTHKYSETTLGAISKSVVTGATPKSGNPDYYENGTVPWLRTNEVNFRPIVKTKTMITEKAVKETGVKWVEPPSVVIAISGASAGRSGTIEVPVTTNQHCCNLGIDNDAANYRFVYHWVSSQYENLKIRGRGARGDLNMTIIKGFPIPLPPRDVQDEIVAQLDAMQELIDSLRLEREQRQKQFDYYREELLSFPQKETAEV